MGAEACQSFCPFFVYSALFSFILPFFVYGKTTLNQTKEILLSNGYEERTKKH